MSVTALKNDTRLDDLDARIENYGEIVGASKEQLVLLGLDCVRAAADGYLLPGMAQGRYEAYLRGMSRKEYHEHSPKGVAANASKLASIIKLGCLQSVDGVGLLDKVVDMRQRMKAQERKVKGAYKTFVEVARAQLAQPETPLSDAAIEAFCDGATPDKDLIDKLIAQYKAAVKTCEECPTDNMMRAVDAYREEIIAQGGDVPAVTKDDKEVVKAVALLAKRGVKIAA